MKNLLLIFCLMMLPTVQAASDLDDGIAIDEPINDDLQTSTNIQFIKARAKASSKKSEQSRQSGKTDKKGSQPEVCGTGNIVIEAGATVKEVINVSTNKGGRINCVTQ